MVFSSLLFSFLFLPVVVGIYYLTKEKYRNYILLIASLLFYSYGEPKFVFVMLGSIVVNYIAGLGISRCRDKAFVSRLILTLDIFANIGTLFIFKYLDFAINTTNKLLGTSILPRGILLPIGISFFTFQSMSYVIDVYRKKVDVQKNVLYLALYISFFPQLIAGPIVRYSRVVDQITNRICTAEKFGDGVRRFFIGFSKKVIIANNLSVVSSEIFDMDLATTNPVLFWIGSISYSLQIFYDFSGYSDMAIGLGKIFGFEFDENFDYPYISKSVSEFWRRWHMSLGQWFRDYVYIPLGGSKVPVLRCIFNMFIVWLLTGIWHGANYTYIVWGLIYFVFIAAEKFIIKPEKRKNIILSLAWRIITLLVINFEFVIFYSSELTDGIRHCFAMIGGYNSNFLVDDTVIMYLREYGAFLIMGVLFATPIMRFIKTKFVNSKMAILSEVMEPVICGAAFVWAVSFIILGSHNPFIYFNF